MSDTWLVVGLGNPGAKYAGNRHNVGHMVIAALAARAGGRPVSHRSGAHVLDSRLGVLPGGAPGPRAVLAVPDSYMNLSGRAVGKLVAFYGVPVERLLVVHDELDLPPHVLRLKSGGGEGGHNGLKSISASLGTRDYARLRIGIGRPPGRMDPADYVLRDFPTAEREDVAVTVLAAADAVEDVVTTGLLAAQQRLHSA